MSQNGVLDEVVLDSQDGLLANDKDPLLQQIVVVERKQQPRRRHFPVSRWIRL